MFEESHINDVPNDAGAKPSPTADISNIVGAGRRHIRGENSNANNFF